MCVYFFSRLFCFIASASGSGVSYPRSPVQWDSISLWCLQWAKHVYSNINCCPKQIKINWTWKLMTANVCSENVKFKYQICKFVVNKLRCCSTLIVMVHRPRCWQRNEIKSDWRSWIWKTFTRTLFKCHSATLHCTCFFCSDDYRYVTRLTWEWVRTWHQLGDSGTGCPSI